MQDPSRYRAALLHRILAVVSTASACSTGASSPPHATSAATASSSSSGAMTRDLLDGGNGGAGARDGGAVEQDGGGGAGGAGSEGPPPVQACFPWPLPPDAGLDSGAVIEPDAGPAPAGCPTDPTVVLDDFLALQCPTGWEPYRVVKGPIGASTTACCYEVYDLLCTFGGRPLKMSGVAIVALPLQEDRGWGAPSAGGDGEPNAAIEALSREDRDAIAAAWAADGAMEHASVASFSRFSLALMAFGAPSELVRLAHRAALDEIDHARACFALASRYAGAPIAPGKLPLNGAVTMEADLAELAASTVTEGCVGETLAAVAVAERLARAKDPAVRATLERIADDEARHAELAWKVVAWALAKGGKPVRDSVRKSFNEALAWTFRGDQEGAIHPEREAHGILDRAATAKAARETLTSVIATAARELLDDNA